MNLLPDIPKKKGSASPPVHVAHVVLQLQTGGMEKLLVEFARHADRQRFRLHFISLGERGDLADDLEAAGWRVTAMGSPTGLRPGLVFRLARLFLGEQIDVVHTHNTRPVIYASFAATLARVPVVVHTRHGQRWQAKGRATLLFGLATRLVNRVACVSHDSARLSVEEGLAPHRICTIWNGIDASRFAYVEPQPRGPAVMVGRLSPEKDVATLLRAVALAIHEEPSFQIQIAGHGVCAADLHQQSKELKLTDHVHFLGEVRDVPALLAKASLFVLPSLTEGISLTLLEAMARGLPVVTTRVGGNPEVVVEGETGLLVPAQSPEALAAAMLRVWRDPSGGREMGRAGRRRVEQHFDVQRMVADYQALYLQLLGRGHSAASVRQAAPGRQDSPPESQCSKLTRMTCT